MEHAPQPDNNNEELTFEEEGEGVVDKTKKLRAALKECEREKAEYLDGWQRARADYVNYQKRITDEHAVSIKRALDPLIEDLLPVYDSFVSATKGESWENMESAWKVGIEQLRDHLKNTLESYGVQFFSPLGAQFDPKVHESVGTKAGEGEDEMVTEVLQEGVMRDERVLRPAKVIIISNNH